MGAIILDGYNRAYVLNLAGTLRRADVDHPLSRALQGDVKVAGASAGPLSIAMTVTQRHDLAGVTRSSRSVWARQTCASRG